MFELTGSRMADDSLCEVGCPYAIRGFDYDYVGILWLDDLRWRLGKWEINPAAVHERGIAHLARQARNEKNPDGVMTRELLKLHNRPTEFSSVARSEGFMFGFQMERQNHTLELR